MHTLITGAVKVGGRNAAPAPANDNETECWQTPEKEQSMISARDDYSSEIMALVVLIVLSALSHFWYVLIVICVGAGLIGMGLLFTRIILRATMVDETKGTP
jgi:hypothetical protein